MKFKQTIITTEQTDKFWNLWNYFMLKYDTLQPGLRSRPDFKDKENELNSLYIELFGQLPKECNTCGDLNYKKIKVILVKVRKDGMIK